MLDTDNKTGHLFFFKKKKHNLSQQLLYNILIWSFLTLKTTTYSSLTHSTVLGGKKINESHLKVIGLSPENHLLFWFTGLSIKETWWCFWVDLKWGRVVLQDVTWSTPWLRCRARRRVIDNELEISEMSLRTEHGRWRGIRYRWLSAVNHSNADQSGHLLKMMMMMMLLLLLLLLGAKKDSGILCSVWTEPRIEWTSKWTLLQRERDSTLNRLDCEKRFVVWDVYFLRRRMSDSREGFTRTPSALHALRELFSFPIHLLKETHSLNVSI